jgi:pyruvate/2-oxoglutarate dehydrogenase complex dihydrolipoamide acyltransferase (E2) component
MLRHVKVREERPLSFLRESVAYLLSQSARTIPHAAAISHFDCTALVEYGESETGKVDAGDPGALFKRALRKNFSAFFLKALAHGLYHHPELNGFLEYTPLRNGGTLYCAEDINISFTVHHPKYGVIKPIVRNAHQKTLEQVADEMRKLTRRARRTDPNELYRRAARAYIVSGLRELDLTAIRALLIYLRATLFPRVKPDPAYANTPEDQKLQPEDVLGATTTLANIGMTFHGHQTVTAIIPPEVTMFGVGDLHQAPAVVDGEVVPRWQVTIVGTIDHRAMDGGHVFPLAAKLKECIDEPARIYEWREGDPI